MLRPTSLSGEKLSGSSFVLYDTVVSSLVLSSSTTAGCSTAAGVVTTGFGGVVGLGGVVGAFFLGGVVVVVVVVAVVAAVVAVVAEAVEFFRATVGALRVDTLLVTAVGGRLLVALLLFDLSVLGR